MRNSIDGAGTTMMTTEANSYMRSWGFNPIKMSEMHQTIYLGDYMESRNKSLCRQDYGNSNSLYKSNNFHQSIENFGP
jgi:hypothetical protein